MTEHELTIEPRFVGRNGTAQLTARVGDETIHSDKIDTAKVSARQRFARQLAERRAGIDAATVERELLRLIESRQPGDAPAGAAEVMAGITEEEVELWHDADQRGYATVPVGEHREHHPIRSHSFRLWLRRRFREREGRTAQGDALAQAIEEAEAAAIFNGSEHEPHVRIAGDDEAIFIDLADDQWRAVKITAEGWAVVSAPDARFTRPRGALPLPMPERGGSVDELRDHLNAGDDEMILLIAWLLAALRPSGPYPILNVSGEQGSAKSTAQRILRALLDPNKAPLRAEPREPRDLVIGAQNAHVLACDNLSYMPGWLSDGLCRLATGGGFATRALYSDSDEVIFDAQRPVMLNGVELVGTRSDLLDRSLTITLDAIPEDQRRRESDLWRSFEAARPRIMGALFDAIAAGLANAHHVELDRLPRLADFAAWIVACEPGLGWTPGTFMGVYDANRAAANVSALESSAIGAVVHRLIQQHSDGWTGTASELLAELERVASDRERHRKGWPADGARLSGQLTRVAPNLRRAGIEVERLGQTGASRSRLIRLRWLDTDSEVDREERIAIATEGGASEAEAQALADAEGAPDRRTGAHRGTTRLYAEACPSACAEEGSADG